jgi:hypothetical protein
MTIYSLDIYIKTKKINKLQVHLVLFTRSKSHTLEEVHLNTKRFMHMNADPLYCFL